MKMRRSKKLDNILDECLERLLVKGESLAACLQSYPEYADELKPLLNTALTAKKALDIEPRPEFSARARYQFYSALREAKVRKGRRFFLWRPVWATAVAIVLVLVLGSGVTVAAAGNSMPDEPLYPVKIIAERVQLTLTPSSLRKAELHARLADRRVTEILYLANKGKPERMESATRRLNNNLARIAALSGARKKMASAVEVPAPPRTLSESAQSKRAVRIPQKNGRVRLRAVVGRNAANHPAALRAALKKAPRSARPALRRALAVAEAGYKEARQALD